MLHRFHNPGTTTLVVFTRYPHPGETKTRLIPALGADGAAALQRQMTEHVLEVALPPETHWRRVIQITGGDAAAFRAWLGVAQECVPQGEGDLGARMLRAVEQQFAAGASRVILIGTDCPGITSWTLREAEAQLRKQDVVLGPAADGGYYLIGLRRSVARVTFARLFGDIASWGTERVLAQTQAIAGQLGLGVALLETLPDVDRPEDVAVWEGARTGQRLSVIIPALNEAEHIQATVRECLRAHQVEVIVVDGGSSDETVARAEAAGAQILHTTRGRAAQMNAGARRATGGLLLFLHADTRLPERYDRWVRTVLSDAGTSLGAFRFAIGAEGLGYRVVEWGAAVRNRLLHLPYGDQALFLRRETFEALGGFPEMPLLEDYELVRRARRAGQVRILAVPAVTSARRWQRHGLWRVTLLNGLIFLLYPLGVSPERIARWYGR